MGNKHIKKCLSLYVTGRSSVSLAEAVGDHSFELRKEFLACGPLASTRMQQPGLAASIMRPMMEVPPTTMPSLLTVTWA